MPHGEDADALQHVSSLSSRKRHAFASLDARMLIVARMRTAVRYMACTHGRLMIQAVGGHEACRQLRYLREREGF